MHLRLNQASLFKTSFFFFFVPYMFLGLWTNNLFMPGMFWGFQTICIFLYMICLLVFPLFVSIVDAFSSSLWGLGEFLLKYSFCPYEDLEEKILFSSLRGLREFLLKYFLHPYLDDIHPFKESYRLFDLDDVHPFKKSYHLFDLDDVHPFKESYRLFHLDDLFGLLRRE